MLIYLSKHKYDKENTEALLVARKNVDLKINYWQNKVYVHIPTKKCVIWCFFEHAL